MGDRDQEFLADLQREDDLGLVIRGHLHIEHQLIEIASASLPFASRVEWNEIPFRAKLEIASACGLPNDRKQLVLRLNKLRNEFAHQLSASIQRSDVIDIYNSLSEQMRDTLKGSFKHAGLGTFPGPSALEPRVLLIFIFMQARQATKAAAKALRVAT